MGCGETYEPFSLRDVRAILNIPFSISAREDSLLWHFDKKGFYTVKLGYHVCERILGRGFTHSQHGGWSRIWRLDIPPKVRDVMWKAMRGVLPTKEALSRRGVELNRGCLFCDSVEEIDHVLIGCVWALEAWDRGIAIDEPDISFTKLSFRRDAAKMFAIIAWKICLAGNELLWKQKWLVPSRVHAVTYSYMQEWRLTSTLLTNVSAPSVSGATDSARISLGA
ncbi:uncharacterized protein LOC119371465 [Jatropha curcas]|uniref:uncharacterized protein LOC119371465 n=1 Tax=Jatropha curcas TaxID=180498 RepID=UPI0018960454|nr:uncharacterized protein LOC119371465 [Jatropha curcas]